MKAGSDSGSKWGVESIVFAIATCGLLVAVVARFVVALRDKIAMLSEM